VLKSIWIYSQIWWLNMSQSWLLCPFKKIISHSEKKFVIVPVWWEKFEKIPAWRSKVGIVLMLINPAWREKFDIVLILHGRRKLWWLMCLTVLFYCVIVIKHSMSLRRTKVTDEPRDKNDMQVWLAKVLMIKDYVEFLKWNEEKYSHTN
jgi:hypothetical protein